MIEPILDTYENTRMLRRGKYYLFPLINFPFFLFLYFFILVIPLHIFVICLLHVIRGSIFCQYSMYLTHTHTHTRTYISIYGVSQEEC